MGIGRITIFGYLLMFRSVICRIPYFSVFSLLSMFTSCFTQVCNRLDILLKSESKIFFKIELKSESKIFFKIELAQNPSPFIYPLESPVFIGVSEVEWYKSTLHHPSSPFILIGKWL